MPNASLNDVLKSLGYTTKPAPEAGLGCKHILKGDKIVKTGDAYEVQAWASGQLLLRNSLAHQKAKWLAETSPTNRRIEHRKAVASMKEDMKKGPVEVLSGPCEGMVVKDAASLLEYSKRLDEWFFPQGA